MLPLAFRLYSKLTEVGEESVSDTAPKYLTNTHALSKHEHLILRVTKAYKVVAFFPSAFLDIV